MLKIQTMGYFSSNLRKYIEQSGLSQGKVADKIGELRTNFNHAVNGKRPLTDDKLRKLAAISELGLTYEELRQWQALDALDKLCEKYPEIKELVEHLSPEQVKQAFEEIQEERNRKE